MTATAIFCLPNELLVAIVAAGQEERIAEMFSQHSRWQIPSATFKSEWTMSQLSRHFRAAIVGAPNLWTLAEAELEHQGSVEVLKLYLERSQACKISITLRESRTSLLDYNLLLRRIRSIAAHFNRVQILRIAITECREEMWSLFRDAAAPVLEHLELISVYNKVGITVEMFSSGAPKLKFFKLDNFVLDSFSAPWTASLTHLELLKCRANTPDLPPIVAQSPQLIHLHLDTDFDRSGAQVHIPTLEFLHVVIPNEEDSDYLVAILNLFGTPALTELKIEGSHGDQIAVLFNSTLLTSFPALTSLFFLYKSVCACDGGNLGFSYHPITQSPPLFPTLTSLTLVNQCFIRNLIRDILGPDAPPRPSLNTVTLYLKDNPKMVVQNVCIDLEEAGKARRERGQVLPKVQLFHTVSAFYNWDNGTGLDFEMMSIW